MDRRVVSLTLLLCLCVASTNSLFKDEPFIRLNEYTVMPSAINITLTKVATVPRSLKMNTLCSVPSFQQMREAVNGSSTTLKRDSTPKGDMWTRMSVVYEVPECEMVGYCNNGGIPGSYYLCLGSKHHLVNDECLRASAKAAMRESIALAETGRAAAHELTMGTVEELLSGTAKLFEKQIGKVENLLKDQLGEVEKVIVAATTQATAVFLDRVKGTFTDMAQQIDAKVKAQRDAERAKYEILYKTTNTIIDQVKGDTATLADMIRSSTMFMTSNTEKLAQNADNLVDKVNLYFDQLDTNVELMRMMLQNTIMTTYNAELPQIQGEDLSPLLVQWEQATGDGVLQGNSTGIYKFVERGYSRSYINSTEYVGEVNNTEALEGKSLYECYEEDTSPVEEEDVDVYECYERGARRDLVLRLDGSTSSTRISDWTISAVSCSENTGNCGGNFRPSFRLPEVLRNKVPDRTVYTLDQSYVSNGSINVVCTTMAMRIGPYIIPNTALRAYRVTMCIHITCDLPTGTPCNMCPYFDGPGYDHMTGLYLCAAPYYLSTAPTVDDSDMQELLQVAANPSAIGEGASSYPRESYSVGQSRAYVITRKNANPPTLRPEVVDLAFEDIYQNLSTIPWNYRYWHTGRKEVVTVPEIAAVITVNGTTRTYNRCLKVGVAKAVLADTERLQWRSDIQGYVATPVSQTTTRQQKADKSNPVLVVDISSSSLLSLLPHSVGFSGETYYYTVGANAVTGVYSVNGSRPDTYVVQGRGHFYMRHPERGSIKIHKCRMVPWNTVNVTANSAVKPVHVMGYESAKYLNLLTTTNHSNPDMRPDRYIYTTDKWCCSAKGQPMVAAANCPADLSVCPSKVLNNVTAYLSPRAYYCSEHGKNTVPIAYGLDYCTTKELPLPGAGVEIRTGVVSPQGLYPAKCMYWTSVSGSVGMYTISVDAKDVAVPTMLTALRGRRVIFGMENGEVIDEMDSIMGLGNGGYDCVTYEMDLLLHNPRNCRNYVMPVYSPAAYYSGLVRSTGLSRLQDYFSMDLMYADNSTYVLQFKLREGIDYESTYVPSRDVCPNLEVSYVSNSCRLSGWAGVKELAIYLGEQRACNVDGVCVSTIDVANNASIQVDIVNGTQRYNCYNFLCKASEQSFVAYPTEAKYNGITRAYKMETISKMIGFDYKAEAEELLDRVALQLEPILSAVKPEMVETYFEVNMTMDMITPDLALIAKSVGDVITEGKEKLANISQTERRSIVSSTRDMLRVLRLNMDTYYDAQTGNLTILGEEIVGNITIKVNAIKSSWFDWLTNIGDTAKETATAFVSAIAGVVLVVVMMVVNCVLIRKA